MNNAFDELTNALSIARAVRDTAKRQSNSMVEMLTEPGALQGVAGWRLTLLKKELARFNMRTERWKR